MDTKELTVRRLLWRGSTLACPACGQRNLFSRWFFIAEHCPRCRLRFERIEGHWAGSLGLNTIVSFGALLLALTAGLILTFPDFPVRTLVIVNIAVAIIVPLVFYPISRTLWTAIDIAMRPLTEDEVKWEAVSTKETASGSRHERSKR